MRRIALAGVAVIAIVFFACPSARPTSFGRDFRAFYCSGVSVREGTDPYRADSLGTCERKPERSFFYTVPSGLTLPAPLPPYDLLGFSLLARLPFDVAAWMWCAVLVAAVGATVEAVHRLTALSRSLLALVFVPIDGVQALFQGEIAPVAVASIALAMLALRGGRPRVAGALLLASLCEPHVGLASVLATFAWVPRSRLPIFIGSTALALCALGAVGTSTTVEYLCDVLPAHAVSEIASAHQLSLTAVMHALRFEDGVALTFGTLSYLAMIVLGFVTAGRRAAADPRDPLIVAAPAAFVLFGGVFIHAIQMPAAFPGALVAYARSTGRLKLVAGSALAVLAVPWLGFLPFGIAVPAAGFLVAMLAKKLLPVTTPAAVVAGGAAALFVYGLELGIAFGDPFPATVVLPPSDPHALAEVDWGRNILALAPFDSAIFELARIPAWTSLLAIVAVLSRSRPAKRFEFAARPDEMRRRILPASP